MQDRVRGRSLALKLHAPAARDDGALTWRLRREFYLMAQLSHPNIVRVLDAMGAGR